MQYSENKYRYKVISADKAEAKKSALNGYQYLFWLFNERRLIGTLIKYELKRAILETKLSYLWWILDPLLKLFCYIFLMLVFGRKTIDGVPYALFIMLAIFPWNFMSKCINDSVNVWTRYEQIIGQIRFPYMALLISSLLSEFVLYMLSFALIILACFYFNLNLTVSWFSLAFIFFYQLILCMALMLLNSFISFLFFDYRKLLPFILNIWFFCSPALWPLSKLSPTAREVFEVNPAVFIFENMRRVILYHMPVNYEQFDVYVIPVTLLLIFSYMFFVSRESYINRYVK